MAVLVTGGGGMLGLHVARALSKRGMDVVAYSTTGAPALAEPAIGRSTERISFVRGDIRDFQRLGEIAEKFNVTGVIHTAALTGEAQARARPQEMFAVNVGGTANVLELARLRGMRRVVCIGTAAEYGRRTDLRPIRESEVNVEGLYAETKFLGCRLGTRYREIFGLDVVTVRLSSVYGPYTRFDPRRGLVGGTLMAHICRAAALKEPLTIDGGADSKRDWTYAVDAAEGICLMYCADVLPHAEYNIASGRLYMTREVVDAVRRLEPQADIQLGPGSWEDDPFHAANVRGPLDISRARKDVGYAPSHELYDGLREYVDWWRQAGSR